MGVTTKDFECGWDKVGVNLKKNSVIINDPRKLLKKSAQDKF